MAPIYLYNGGILLRNGMIAIGPNCCCSSSSSSSSTVCYTPTQWRLVVFDNNNIEKDVLAEGSITFTGVDYILNDYPGNWSIHQYWTPLPNTYKVQVYCAGGIVGVWTDFLEYFVLDNYVQCEFGGSPPSWWRYETFETSYANICCDDGFNLNYTANNKQGNAKGTTFNNTIDTEWTNMNNWDDGTKMELPTSGDTVTIAGSAFSSSSSGISVDTLTISGTLGITISVQTAVTVTDTGSVVDSSLNSVCGKEGTLDCQAGTTVLISGTINGGTVTGANVVTFENNGYILNNGLITNVTTVIFNNNSAAYDCQIDGASVFNDTSICYGTIKANSIEFNDNAINIAGSTLTGGDNITQDIIFNDTSDNGGSVNGHYDVPVDCTINSASGFVSDFRNSSQNSGTVQRVKFMDTSANNGSATESLFLNSSYSTASTTSCNFCDTSYNDTAGTSTTCKFYDTSYNNGTADNSTFYETSENRATANNATFEDTSSSTNTGTVNNSVFKDTSYNDGVGTDVIFEDSSYNNTNGNCDITKFYNDSENRGTCNTNSSIDTEFHDCSKNKGLCINNAKFYNSSTNASAGTIGGGFFYDSSMNVGTVSYNCYFSSSVSPPRCCNNGTINGSATFDGTSFNNGTVLSSVTYNGYTGYISSFTNDCGENVTVNAYFILGQKTTLDSSGSGCWNNNQYTNGSITGSC